VSLPAKEGQEGNSMNNSTLNGGETVEICNSPCQLRPSEMLNVSMVNVGYINGVEESEEWEEGAAFSKVFPRFQKKRWATLLEIGRKMVNRLNNTRKEEKSSEGGGSVNGTKLEIAF
jgi:hypothetical protein